MYTRQQLVTRVNSLMYEGLYSWEDMKWEFDKAIAELNTTLVSTYPDFTTTLEFETSKYSRTVIPVDELPETADPKLVYKLNSNQKLYNYRFVKNLVGGADPYNPFGEIKTVKEVMKWVEVNEDFLNLLPPKVYHQFIIPYVVAQLLAREDEFGTLYQNNVTQYNDGLMNAFRDLLSLVPKEYIDTRGGSIKLPTAIGGWF